MKKALALLMLLCSAILAQEAAKTAADSAAAGAPAAPVKEEAAPAAEKAAAADSAAIAQKPQEAAADSAVLADSTAAALADSTAADSTAIALDSAAAEPPPEPEPTPVQEEAAPVLAVAEKSPPIEAREISFNLGLRAGVGISNFRSHVALKVADGLFALKLQPAFAASYGIAAQIGISDFISAAPELMYALYRSGNEAEVKNQGEFNNVYDAGVYMHSLELPILARFHLKERFIYAELGPQLGLNLYSKIYKNADYYRPDMNLLAFGAAAGAGMNYNGTAMGIRGYFGFLEYAKDAKGIPWNIQLSISHFIF